MKLLDRTDKFLEAAKIFGLKGDILGTLGIRDRFDESIIRPRLPMAFLTKVVTPPGVFLGNELYQELEHAYVNLGQSEIADHDATQEPGMCVGWEELVPSSKLTGVAGRLLPALTDKHVLEYQNFFYTHDATFVAVELNRIPERLFLYVTEKRFDIEYVIERLRDYRALHPLPSIQEMARAYTVL